MNTWRIRTTSYIGVFWPKLFAAQFLRLNLCCLVWTVVLPIWTRRLVTFIYKIIPTLKKRFRNRFNTNSMTYLKFYLLSDSNVYLITKKLVLIISIKTNYLDNKLIRRNKLKMNDEKANQKQTKLRLFYKMLNKGFCYY